MFFTKGAGKTARGSFLYNRVYDALLTQIREGRYAEGEKLPGEKELKREYGISTITLNKSLSLLVEDGLVRRVPGRGTFVLASGEIGTKAAAGMREPFIGLVLEHVSTPFGLDMLSHMNQEAERAGYRLLVRFSYGDQGKESDAIEFLRAKGAAGILLMPCHGRQYSQTILKLYLESFPLVLVDKKLNGITLPSVRTDNHAAVAELVHALYTCGARRMAFVSARDEDAPSTQERAQGFRESMRRLSLPEPRWFWIPFARGPESYTRRTAGEETLDAARAFFREAKGSIDAVISAEYGFVPSLTRAADAAGVRFGRDMMLASIDGDEYSPCGVMFPYMKQDEAAIAKKAMELLLARMNGEPVVKEDYLVPALYRAAQPILSLKKGTL